MADDLERLKERITALSTEELLTMVSVEYKDYRQEALNFAMAELASRGVEYRSPLAKTFAASSGSRAYEPPEGEPDEGEDEEDEDGSEDESGETGPPVCKNCGSEARLGNLFSDREITIVFGDNNEERFVEVHACPKCGNVQLEIDYDTDVEPGDR
ncbi:MAG TPA: hypothetical protein VI756_17620 [Blastocatellia bacterium]